MDMEQIQKINSLALELMKQGMASDREDAVRQAERIYKDKSAENSASFRPSEPRTETRPEQRNQTNTTVTNADLPAEKVREILDQNTKFLVKTIKEFQEQMKSMEQEISSLKTKMTYHRPAEPAAALAQATQASSAAAASSSMSKQQALQGGPAADGSSHPRLGQYKQADVSIEKVFYMGGKK